MSQLEPYPNFTDVRLDRENAESVTELFATHRPQRVVNLAAQAGVRYSLKNPRAYIDANISGFLSMLLGSIPKSTTARAYSSIKNAIIWLVILV